jgi:hypothetical protein
MRDIGALVWIVLVIFGVVSSIAQSARRATKPQRGGARPPVPQPQPQPRPPVPPPAAAPQRQVRVNVNVRPGVQVPAALATLMAQFERDAQIAAGQRSVPPPEPVAAPPARAVRPPAAMPPPHHEPIPARSVRLFADRATLVRGIVAAEVLGKPLALRDE